MIYIRREGIDPIRQGFNFYPSWSVNVGCQMLFWRLRIQVRYAKRTGVLHLGCWMYKVPTPAPEVLVYIPNQTEYLKELYEKANSYWDKKYENWEHDPEVEKRREWEQAERNRIRDELRKAAQ